MLKRQSSTIVRLRTGSVSWTARLREGNSHDQATLVRLSWVKSDVDGARRICRESGDSNATYQHAKYLQQYCTASGGWYDYV